MGSTSTRRPAPREVVEARFWAKVEKAGPDDCWLWKGGSKQGGYGIVRGYDGRLTTAHRLSMVIDGRDPGPLFCRHRCDNPPCVNPAHLLAGTHQQNMDDARERGSYAGERNAQAKLTNADVLRIRELAAAGKYLQREIAAMFGIRQPAVSDIVRRRRWTHVEAAA